MAPDDQTAQLWHQALVKTYLERDVPQLGFRVPGPELRRFLSMLAHSHGQLLNASKMAANFGVSDPAIRRYAKPQRRRVCTGGNRGEGVR
ncbi:MAG: DUF4143 domain-containing protein [Acidobacteriota bacterium]